MGKNCKEIHMLILGINMFKELRRSSRWNFLNLCMARKFCMFSEILCSILITHHRYYIMSVSETIQVRPDRVSLYATESCSHFFVNRKFLYYDEDKLTGAFKEWNPPTKKMFVYFKRFSKLMEELEEADNGSRAYFQVSPYYPFLAMALRVSSKQ